MPANLSEARAILASFAAHPPRRVEHVDRYAITADRWHRYTGRRVRRLEALADAALIEGDRTGDYAAFHAIADVTGLIDGAIAEGEA